MKRTESGFSNKISILSCLWANFWKKIESKQHSKIELIALSDFENLTSKKTCEMHQNVHDTARISNSTHYND